MTPGSLPQAKRSAHINTPASTWSRRTVSKLSGSEGWDADDASTRHTEALADGMSKFVSRILVHTNSPLLGCITFLVSQHFSAQIFNSSSNRKYQQAVKHQEASSIPPVTIAALILGVELSEHGIERGP